LETKPGQQVSAAGFHGAVLTQLGLKSAGLDGQAVDAVRDSMFACRLQPDQLRRLREGLKPMATAEDSVRLWAMPQRAPAAEQLGRPVETTVWEDKVI
jgi:CRISPR/Cas system-associated endoribonuclease Cas2